MKPGSLRWSGFFVVVLNVEANRMKSRLKGRKRSRALREDLEVQQKALEKIIRALEECDPSSDDNEIQSSKPDKNEKT